RRDGAVGDEEEAIAGAAQERAIVRDDNDRTGEILQGHEQRVAHVEIQEVGFAGDEDRERQAGALATGELARRLEYAIAAKAEAAEMIAPLQLGPARLAPAAAAL